MSLRKTSSAWRNPCALDIAQLRRLREHVQVAAVCYRVGWKGIEFLLVQTRESRRWTFPKGGIEPGLSHAQAAALEAYEEAGVHGRMEETSFLQYVRRANGRKKSTDRTEVVRAHLCEVLWLEPPEEPGRNPTWFVPHAAKRRLRKNRPPEFVAEIERVLDRAVERIKLSYTPATASGDGLHKVRFEALDQIGMDTRFSPPAFSQHVRSLRYAAGHSRATELEIRAHLSKVLQFAPPLEFAQSRGLLGEPQNERTRRKSTSTAQRRNAAFPQPVDH